MKVVAIFIWIALVVGVSLGALIGYVRFTVPLPPPVVCPEKDCTEEVNDCKKMVLDNQQMVIEMSDETIVCKERLLQCQRDIQTALIDGVLRIKDNK